MSTLCLRAFAFVPSAWSSFSLKYLDSSYPYLLQIYAQMPSDQVRLPLTILSKWQLLSAYHFSTLYTTLFFSSEY